MSSVDDIFLRFEPLIVVINHIALFSHLYLDFISYYRFFLFLPESIFSRQPYALVKSVMGAPLALVVTDFGMGEYLLLVNEMRSELCLGLEGGLRKYPLSRR